jgi:PPOX class probable F420-dependent enzyme
MTDNAPLGDEKYISLETFKKDGTGVKTPVWCAPLDGKLIVFSAGDAYKVKRVRNNPKCRAAPCDVRGNVSGAWIDGTARIVDDPAFIDRALASLRKKYGVLFAVTDFFSAISGKKKKRAYLEITL